MTPVNRCLVRIDQASALTDSTVVSHVADALDDLEFAYRSPAERIVALEEILQQVARNRHVAGRPFGRFLRLSVERRQIRLARIYA